MVYIMDQLPGTGKTSRIIDMINNSTDDEKFLYVTPYLDEVDRIIEECKSKNFSQPISTDGKSKGRDLKNKLAYGLNIATTHAMFSYFDEQFCDVITRHNYTLILDEAFDVIDVLDILGHDKNSILQNHVLKDKNNKLEWNYDSNGRFPTRFNDVKRYCDSGILYAIGDNPATSVLIKIFPIEVFESFQDIYILTYKFKYQLQKYYYDVFNVEYKYINSGIIDLSEYKKLFDVYSDVNLNMVGNARYSLSKRWFKRNVESEDKMIISELKNNMYNYSRHKTKSKSENIIWTTFKDYKKYISGKGYARAFIPVNTRATNKYREKSTAAYLANWFVNPNIRNWFRMFNVEINEDKIALLELIQFVFRTRVRDRKPINLYIPSKRMRELFLDWIESI